MTRRRVSILLAAGLAGVSCRQAPVRPGPSSPHVPRGNVVWFADPAAANDPALDAALARLGAVAVFLPSGTLGASPGPGLFAPSGPPAKPLRSLPAVLVLEPDAALTAAPTGADGPEGGVLAPAAASALSREISSGAYGKVAGVHLDFPLVPRSAAKYAAFITGLRNGLPPGTFVSITLASLPPGPEDRKKLAPAVEAADALVAFVFGTGTHVDPIATDGLGRPWWAGYDLRVVGELRDASGAPRGPVPERLLEPLSGNPRFEFENDLTGNDASVSAFTLTARAPFRQDGLSIEPGERVAFRVPSVSEMLFQLGSNLAGKRHALGRAALFGGATEGERVFPVAALEDVLLGRALRPALEAHVRPAGRGAIAVDLVNGSHHASVASRVDNWIEVDVSPAHPADVQVGGFDRYEVYDRAGHPVTPGRAATVRLFETLIAPLESVSPARIVVRGALPASCCRYRIHAMSAAGPEIAGDWVEPPPPPTPAAPARGRAAARKR